jgi:hypothetical protein
MKKLIWSGLIAFGLCFVLDLVFHGFVMKSAYESTAQIWRPQSEMQNHFWSMLLGQFMVGFFFSWIFAHGYKGTGWSEGLRFGVLIAAFDAGKNFIMYAVNPWELWIVASWIGIALFQGIVIGMALAWFWGKQTPAKKPGLVWAA